MRIGYACITHGINKKYRTCRLKNATNNNLHEIIEHNLQLLEEVIDYNYQHNIKMFRISSDIIPFASKQEINYDWQSIFKEKLNKIGLKINKYNIRVSMHPGQYTVLNSPTVEVVERAMLDLRYHADFLNLLNTDITSKIVLHVGGVYGDKDMAIERFVKNYKLLDSDIKKRLVIENDEKNYNISEVLKVSAKLNIPIVFDNLHHQVNNAKIEEISAIKAAINTWHREDGTPKIHYSEQAPQQKIGAHSQTIELDKLKSFYQKVSKLNLDIMLEVKDKDLSAIRCIKEIERIS